MERESGHDRAGRDRSEPEIDALGDDEDEFSSIEDVGDAPSENPSVDDV